MIQTIHAKDRDEWLALRKRGLGSSEMGTIIGVNPYDTPYQLWLRKTGRVEQTEENTAMRMGHLLEPIVAQLYEEKTGERIDSDSVDDFVVINDLRPYMVASPDRYVQGKNGLTLLECKTTAFNVSADDYPKSWFCQVQYLMACSGLREASLAWLINGREFGYTPIAYSQKFVDFLLEKADRFWDCVQKDTPPEDLRPEDLALMFPTEEKGKEVVATDDIYGIYTQLKEVELKLADLDGKKEELITNLKAAMTDAEKLVYGNMTLATWKSQKANRLDTTRLKAECPEIAAQYTKVSESRVFRLK